MLTTLRTILRRYEEHVDQLIQNGFEPNEVILNKIESIKRQIKILESVGA